MSKKYILGLRTCKNDMTSRNGFVWPEKGHVECSDWNPEPICGGGLHFLPWGEGDGELLDWSDDAKWLVVKVQISKSVDIDGAKSKCPECDVVFCGDRFGATNYIFRNGGADKNIVGGTATAGYRGTATAGYRGTATAGDGGTATAGNYGTATAGYRGTIIIKRWNGKRYKFSIGYVGEGDIKPNTLYKLDDDGNFVEVPR